LRGYDMAEMFLAAVGLAVAAIPEGLPAIITITLAIGVQRMARRNAIIRRLPAVETLGSVTVICSDKTGTLTCNEMTVQAVVQADCRFEIEGEGYDARGRWLCGGEPAGPDDYPGMLEVCRAALLCNDAAVRHEDGAYRFGGNPMEAALAVLAVKGGLVPEREYEELPRADVIPFESQHKFMATLHHDHAGHAFVFAKGAPEVLLPRCHRERYAGEDLPLRVEHWEREIHALAGRGFRTLALAARTMPQGQQELAFDDLETGLTLLAVVGLLDPPREEAVQAVAACRAAGIRVKMITGDHAVTAASIAARMGIGEGDGVVTGAEIEALDDAELPAIARSADVFARVSPEHKLRLVKALQAAGEVTAMTGDGVNDAPALKRADVGVAMGVKGTEAAKEAAEMVLADDNFASIAAAVEEGRTVFDNIRKSILFILPTNGGEALIILAAVLLGRLLPVTPAQILWVNMITAVTLALALAFEPAESRVMARAPRDPRAPLLSGFMLWRIAFVAVLMVIGAFGLFLFAREQGADIETARTLAVNTLVLLEVAYLFNARFMTEPSWTARGMLGSRPVLIAVVLVIGFQLLFTYLPVMQQLFQTRPLPASDWLVMAGIAVVLFLLVEIEKALLRWRGAAVDR
jgi:calcium-translocating P-type ATPase